jgi:hypothetical protein
MDELVSGALTWIFTYGLRPISENQLVRGTRKPSFFGSDGPGKLHFLANMSSALTNTLQFEAFGAPVASNR